MNILFYENIVNPESGGVQRVTYTLAREFTRQNCDNCYVAHYAYDDFADDSVFKGVLFCRNNSITLLEEYVIKNRIDVVINQLARNCQVVKILFEICQRYNVRLINCLHISPNASMESCHHLSRFFLKDYFRAKIKHLILSVNRIDLKELRYSYQKSDKFVVLSPLYVKQICDLLKVDGEKLVSIYNPLSFQNTTATNKEKIILVVARMKENPKRVSLVLKIWELLQNKIPGWSLYLIGDGPQLSFYKELCEEKKLINVHFLGRQDPRPYYEKATMFLMTSAQEGFGMTLIEAQQFGVIPIAFDSPAVFGDIIINGENGFLVPEGNLKLFANIITNIVSDDSLRNKISINAIKYSHQFTPNIIVNEWTRMLTPLVAKAK